MKMEKIKKITTDMVVGIIALLIAGLLLFGCTQNQTGTGLEPSDDLKKFASSKELAEFLQKSQQTGYNVLYGGIRRDMVAMEESADSAKGAPTAAPSAQGADDYSTTNIQVEGVDEADFVKNDGKHIYMIADNKLLIVDAFPAENSEIISETEIKGRPRDLFVAGDRLVVFAEGDDEVLAISEYDFVPRPRYAAKTHAFVFDISDKEAPELMKDFDVSGYYFQSRMIGNHVYFIAKDYVYYFNNFVDMPVLRESGKIIASPGVFYFDMPFNSYTFHTIASFDISDPDAVNAESFMLADSSTLYASNDNIYISYPKSQPYGYYEGHNRERFFDIVLPLLPGPVQQEIRQAEADDALTDHEKWEKISSILENMYNGMEESEKKELISKIEGAVEDYELKLEQERRKTVIHRISIDDGTIAHEAKGEVSGYLLNQFSLDEHENNLRVATTTYVYGPRESTMYNNVFVLNPNMEVIGKLEDIAPEERIYSTRFIGDRLYMVTFKNIDPFFVIDLSSPENPAILGQLKIPGYSDYLHPYDENHIIGIGKETEGNEFGGISTKGIKLALFDVSDVSNPRQVAKYEIGQQGTESEALHEHKAFLFDREKELLVLPIMEVKGRYFDSKYGYYRNNVWQGAYAFTLTPERGFELRGTVAHSEDAEDYYYGSPNAVRRSLFMDDVLYTISSRSIKMSDLGTIESINEVKLPYTEYPDYPIPLMTKPGIAE